MPSEQVLRSADEKVEKNRANPPLFGTFWRGFTAIPPYYVKLPIDFSSIHLEKRKSQPGTRTLLGCFM